MPNIEFSKGFDLPYSDFNCSEDERTDYTEGNDTTEHSSDYKSDFNGDESDSFFNDCDSEEACSFSFGTSKKKKKNLCKNKVKAKKCLENKKKRKILERPSWYDRFYLGKKELIEWTTEYRRYRTEFKRTRSTREIEIVSKWHDLFWGLDSKFTKLLTAIHGLDQHKLEMIKVHVLKLLRIFLALKKLHKVAINIYDNYEFCRPRMIHIVKFCDKVFRPQITWYNHLDYVKTCIVGE